MSPLEAYHDAMEHKEEAHQMFMLGYLDITDKAKIERLYWEISEKIVKSVGGQ
jgi:arginine decarboxylase